MTSLPLLIDAISLATRKSPRTVREIARRSMDGGTLAGTARGLGASKRPPREAAILLITSTASPVGTSSNTVSDAIVNLQRSSGSLVDPWRLFDAEAVSKEFSYLQGILLQEFGVDAVGTLLEEIGVVKAALNSIAEKTVDKVDGKILTPDILLSLSSSQSNIVLSLEFMLINRNKGQLEGGFERKIGPLHYFIWESHWATGGISLGLEFEHRIATLNINEISKVGSLYQKK